MKKYLLYASLFIPTLWSFSGCATNIRYTAEEIKDYPPAVQQQIKQGDVAIGMTTQQVRYSWGSPSTVNVISPTQDGKPREEWIYSSLGVFMKRRLLFIDGKLADVFPEVRRTDDGKKNEQQ